jgi:hypothetical protein
MPETPETPADPPPRTDRWRLDTPAGGLPDAVAGITDADLADGLLTVKLRDGRVGLLADAGSDPRPVLGARVTKRNARKLRRLVRAFLRKVAAMHGGPPS